MKVPECFFRTSRRLEYFALPATHLESPRTLAWLEPPKYRVFQGHKSEASHSL
jgi:hypothetical protein